MTQAIRPSITAIVLTKDEEPHIRRCIESLAPAVERICVIDSGSTDNTLQIALSLGTEVFENPWINYAAQFNWALDNCNITSDWVLRLDADEYLEPALQTEIENRVPALPPTTRGILIKRKYYFLGRWVRHGGLHPLSHLRLWRNGSARVENRWMDEHVLLTKGYVDQFEGALVDDNQRDLAWWSQKHVQYATREAVQVLLDELGMAYDEIEANASPDQATTKRRLKNNVYNKLPLGFGPSLYLVYRLIPRLGIMDGATGVAFHVLQGFWYRLLVDLRRLELRRQIAGLTTSDLKLKRLEELTGLKIQAFRLARQQQTVELL